MGLDSRPLMDADMAARLLLLPACSSDRRPAGVGGAARLSTPVPTEAQ